MRPFLPSAPALLILATLAGGPAVGQESFTPDQGLLPPGAAQDLVIDRGVPAPGEGPIPYVIVTSRSLRDEFRALARERIRAGIPSAVRSLESLRSEYPSAVDEPDRVRRFLRDAHDHWGTRWVLLGGDAEVVPPRRVTLVDILGERSFVSDWYFACLDGTWDADGDGRYGEAPNPYTGDPGDAPDLVPELFVGRAPVANRDEARSFVRKTLAYERRENDTFEDRTLLFANRLAPFLDFAFLAEGLLPRILDDPAQHVTRLYESWDDPAWSPGALPETRQSVLAELEAGHNIVLGLGAGSPELLEVGYRFPPDAQLLTVADVLGLANGDRAGHVWLLTSLVSAFDQPTSLAEAFLRAPAGGSVTVIGPSDLTFAFQSFELTRRFVEVVYDEGAATIGEALVRARSDMVPAAGGPAIAMSYQLLGDPLLRIFHGSPIASAGQGPDRGLTGITGGAPPGEEGAAADERTVTRTLVAAAPRAGGAKGPRALPMRLSPPAPSPAATQVRVDCWLPVELVGTGPAADIVDLGGRVLRTLDPAAAAAGAGVTTLSWDLKSDRGERVRPGVYFMRVRAGGLTRAARLVVTSP